MLRSDFVKVMFAELRRFKRADGIVSRESIIDQRPPVEASNVSSARKMDRKYLLELAARGPKGWGTVLGRAHHRFLTVATRRDWFWRGRSSRRIGPATLFIGPVLGNGSGFIFRTKIGKEMGGYYPDEFPASDLTFYARFAARYHLRQHREAVCTYRVAENESLKLETAKAALKWIYRLQRDLAGVHVPKWFLRFSPTIMEHWRSIYATHWRIDIQKEELERLLELKLPEDRPGAVLQLRLLLKGI
jgi:hypothetical protein